MHTTVNATAKRAARRNVRIARGSLDGNGYVSKLTPVKVAEQQLGRCDVQPVSRWRPTRPSARESTASLGTRAPALSRLTETLPDTPAARDAGPRCTSRHGYCCAPVPAHGGL